MVPEAHEAGLPVHVGAMPTCCKHVAAGLLHVNAVADKQCFERSSHLGLPRARCGTPFRVDLAEGLPCLQAAQHEGHKHVSKAVQAANIASCPCRLDPVTGALVGCYFHAHRPQDGQWRPASHTPLSEEGEPLAYVAKHAHGLYRTVSDRRASSLAP